MGRFLPAIARGRVRYWVLPFRHSDVEGEVAEPQKLVLEASQGATGSCGGRDSQGPGEVAEARPQRQVAALPAGSLGGGPGEDEPRVASVRDPQVGGAHEVDPHITALAFERLIPRRLAVREHGEKENPGDKAEELVLLLIQRALKIELGGK